MNKKQILDIAEKYVTFQIITNNYESGMLNLDKIDFPFEGVLKIVEASSVDVYLQIKDIRIVRGVGRL